MCMLCGVITLVGLETVAFLEILMRSGLCSLEFCWWVSDLMVDGLVWYRIWCLVIELCVFFFVLGFVGFRW